ncbi:bis(5'-nucleosyl)-tetraphosphatase (symmetrical) YqeK [Thalassobacillus hwangdonensis]|uniref:bis(5'-nucleosyl)-tetraphosphatase (symmetrical) n=1 Tax=Thalassobacillus hwangdonensis TaxID=546108 RepID=A0ABW3L017_9BACI
MKLDRQTAWKAVESRLKKERYEHTERVVKTAIELAERNDADVYRAEFASILHDYAKYRDREEMRRWILKDHRLPKDLLDYHHELWHGPVGALLVERELGVNDAAILSAVSCHTTGKKNMSMLDKIVFLADYIEPGRKFPGVEDVRKAAESDLNEACLMASRNTIRFLMSKNQAVYPDTFHAYNDLLTKH